MASKIETLQMYFYSIGYVVCIEKIEKRFRKIYTKIYTV